MTNPVLQDVINKYKYEVHQKAIVMAPGTFSLETVQTPVKGLKSFLVSIREAIRAFFGSIRSKVKQSIKDGEEVANTTLLPDPEITMLQVSEIGTIPRGCSIWEYNNSARTVVKATIEEVEFGNGKRNAIIEKEGCKYFYALNEKSAKSKVGIL